MNYPIKQHYVPQTYLEKFSFSNKNAKKIYSLHKDQNRIINTNIRDVGVERNFYTLENKADKYLWEELYSKEVEPSLKKILTKIYNQVNNLLIQNQSIILDLEMKKQLSISIIYQLLRGKHSREFQKNFFFEYAPKVIGNIRKTNIEINESTNKILNQFMEDDKFFKEISFETIFNEDRLIQYTNLLLSKNFVIFKIMGDSEFITSDNPIMFIDANSLIAKPFSNGMIDSTTVIYFPIDPKIIVAVYHTNFLFGLLNEYDGRLLFIDSQYNSKFIEMQNKKQYEQSFNQVYGRNEKELKRLIK